MMAVVAGIEARLKENGKVELTAKEYFDALKESKKELKDKDLIELINSAEFIASRAMITGQTDILKNMVFMMTNIERMQKLSKLKYNTYIDRADVERFTKMVKDKSVYIIELSKFKRIIPDDVIEKIAEVKDLFDEMYVVYTDYSADVKKEVKKKVIEKDPIVFGVFRNKEDKLNYDKMFFIADWIDDYCDLTFSELVNTMAKNGHKGVKKTIGANDMPVTIEGLRKIINDNAEAKKK